MGTEQGQDIAFQNSYIIEKKLNIKCYIFYETAFDIRKIEAIFLFDAFSRNSHWFHKSG